MKLSVQDYAMFIYCDTYLESHITNGRDITFLPGKHPINYKLLKLGDEIISLFKPILRPFSEMTEEEMKELYFLVFKRAFVGNNITHRDIGKKEERYVLWSGVERLFIYSDGDIGADCDLAHFSVHQPTVVKWMISKQLDVFGWIEKGLAIDKTKTTNP